MNANLFMGGASSSDNCGDNDFIIKYGKDKSKLIDKNWYRYD